MKGVCSATAHWRVERWEEGPGIASLLPPHAQEGSPQGGYLAIIDPASYDGSLVFTPLSETVFPPEALGRPWILPSNCSSTCPFPLLLNEGLLGPGTICYSSLYSIHPVRGLLEEWMNVGANPLLTGLNHKHVCVWPQAILRLLFKNLSDCYLICEFLSFTVRPQNQKLWGGAREPAF